ncbi:prolyl aminopeptidase [Methylotenera sp.]|uniref:prolyl aminopeptidase n=1 Tax=Methylotenera sp. TaxID=2051956 RepID=UPI0027265364|nr:prolyl aminopeptidase [Methylotenera sp.]MDO9206436.1 prolyl aminopeptidase [Methylotenera sp.]MDP1523291.1 prolyl aminopeptidase [Methylotenera sp.]MDP2070688.1 prolyl aminopeptidase [Methylotenera sp.]MDP2231450.1 prolyl aminopeptidase [Methylotenera sp.]MDP3004831.1 prolyl aminopeptidase [Methylotenera sp.]
MQNKTYNLYPEIDYFDTNTLNTGNSHEVYYEVCGSPTGVPVVFLHGGPGSGCNPTQRRFFDPAYYRIILIDQRGCGRSKPQGSIEKNTTDDLVNDIEAIRAILGIKQWLVFGGSWGSTLALCYALAFPQRVTGLILRGIFLSRPSELSWFLGQVKTFFPESWDALCAYLPDNKRHNPLEAYEQLISSDDINVNIPAAIRWNAFEGSIMSLLPRTPASVSTSKADSEINGETELARARVQIHYIQNHCFVGHRDLLAEAKAKLAHMPTQIIQGRYDMVCPPITAWELSRAMPHAEFQIIQDAGHSAMETGITSALVAATEKFKH